MDGNFIDLTPENIGTQHICCAFSDKKCATGYALKKEWLTGEFERGYVFRRLDERAKVFLEYGPAENAWMPIEAPGYLALGCFWVSGQYKGHGYAKTLLQSALDDAARQGKHGLVAIVGTKKMHFMADGAWLLRQGFTECARLPYGFSLLVKKLDPAAPDPAFGPSALSGECPDKEGLVAYYTNRCPFTELYVREMLAETAAKRGIPLKVIKLETREQARTAPTPATIFSLFRDGRFVTTDISACMDSRFDKIAGK
ncbi:MAG: YoaP domain-containing protein [Rikenellaceae bacterium]|jgi:GNAT superfamily N-acetyltransferase|nr:YoaP domain-containing protein [Rikenellaceae bacterium]